MKQVSALQVIVRPLVVGERVTLSGAVNVTGVVEQLDFLQTVRYPLMLLLENILCNT